MKTLIAFAVVTTLAHAAFAKSTENKKEQGKQCHAAVLESLNKKKDLFEKALQDEYGQGLKVHFTHNTLTSTGSMEPAPITIQESGAPRKEGTLDSRHLIYALEVKHNNKISFGGVLIVQCNGDDRSKVDDLSEDGKIDSDDVIWLEDIAAE